LLLPDGVEHVWRKWIILASDDPNIPELAVGGDHALEEKNAGMALPLRFCLRKAWLDLLDYDRGHNAGAHPERPVVRATALCCCNRVRFRGTLERYNRGDWRRTPPVVAETLVEPFRFRRAARRALCT
jgi:hypothetical protein